MSSVVRPAAALAVVVATLVAAAGEAVAQDTRGYLGGGVAMSPWRPESVSSGASLSFGNTSDDDWAPALQVEAGGFLSRHVGLGVAFALPARRDVEQTYNYSPSLAYRAEIRYREASSGWFASIPALVRAASRRSPAAGWCARTGSNGGRP